MHRIIYRKLMFILVLIFSFCAVSSGFADDDSKGRFAPLSPKFLKWQKEQQSRSTVKMGLKVQSSESESNSASSYPNGYIPIPVDFSHLANNPPKKDTSNSSIYSVKTVKADTLPSAFDLRNVNGKSYVSGIKDQSPWGTCWAHAALGAMESNYMMQGNSELDLSEMHVAWYAYRNSDKSRAFEDYSNYSFSYIMDMGGNSFFPVAMFARLDGPAGESDVPYSTQPSQPNPESYPRVLRLRDAYYLSITDTLNVNDSESQRNIIKRLIMQNGSVVANYYNDNYLFYETSSGVTTYHTETESVNHAVQIVGWDDNFSRNNFRDKPGSDGAWLIKNSWGDRWYSGYGRYMGDSGYFWMSYESYLTEGTSFVVEAVNPNMKVYEYDPLGICSLWTYNRNTVYAANVFKSEGNETLTEVGMYTGDNNLSYEISVYKGMKSMPSSSPVHGSKVSHTSGNIAYAGYHTITLDTPVSLSEGEYFSVVVKFKGTGMIPIETIVYGWSDNAVIESGSFFSPNGSSWEKGTSNGINACIKAFTITDSSTAGTAPKIADGYPPDAYLNEEYSATLSASGTQPITWSVIRGTPPTGLTLSSNGVISGIPTDRTSQTFTVQAANSYGSDTKTFTMNVWASSSPQPQPQPQPTLTITTSSLEFYAGYSCTGQLELSQSLSATWKAESSLPSGLKLNASTGVITGKASKAGDYTVTFTASTSQGNITKDVTIIVNAKPKKPALKKSSLAKGYVNTPYSQELVFTGTTPISVTINGLPNGLNVNESTGLITGTPVTAGTYSLKLKAENIATKLENKPVTKTLKLVINDQPPELDIADDFTLPDAKVGESYSYTFNISSGTGKLTWKASGLPAGIKFSNGTLSGKPTKAGNFKITLTLSNSGGKFTAKIPIAVLQAPVITAKLSAATTGKKYSAKLTAKGTTPITWDVSGLPDTLTYEYNAKGTQLTIKGIPEEMNTYSLNITASNSAGSTSLTASLNVKGVAPKLSVSLGKGYVGDDYSGSKISTTGTKPMRLEYVISASDKRKFGINSLSDLGLSFSYDSEEGTAEITGTPTKSVKSLPIKITAINGAVNTPVSRTAKLTITGTSSVLSEPSDTVIRMNETISINNVTSTPEPEITITLGQERNELSLSAGQSEFLNNNGYDIVAVLPEIKASVSGMYDLDVELDEDAETGAELIWLAFPKDYETTSDDEISEFYDESGEEITSVPESRKITVSAWLTEGITYEPVIAVKSKN